MRLSPPVVFSVIIDVIADNTKKSLVYEILYVDDLFFVSETIGGLFEKCLYWKRLLLKKRLKVNHSNMKSMKNMA